MNWIFSFIFFWRGISVEDVLCLVTLLDRSFMTHGHSNENQKTLMSPVCILAVSVLIYRMLVKFVEYNSNTDPRNKIFFGEKKSLGKTLVDEQEKGTHRRVRGI